MSASISTFPETADQDLEHRVALFLTSQQPHAFREIKVRAQRGTVTLSGSVGSFYHKQLGYHAARRVAGVIQVTDALRVDTPQALAPHRKLAAARP